MDGHGHVPDQRLPGPARRKRTVTLRYSQLCRNQEGLTDFLFPLSTAKYTSHPVERVSVRVAIESQEEIKNVYSPTHAVEIGRPDNRHAIVTYTVKNEVPTSDFRLFYDVGRGSWARGCSAIARIRTRTAISSSWPAPNQGRRTRSRSRRR